MIGWDLLPPPGDAPCSRLDRIRAFRGRVLFEHGRRPVFRQADGSYTDRDPLDTAAYHVSARMAGVVVGCVRLLPVSVGSPCLTEQLIGSGKFAHVLRANDVNRSQTAEGGRWVVDPAHRRCRLGVLLAAGGVALARALGYRLLVCPVGTRRKQDRVLARLGLEAVADVPPIVVPHFDDTLRVMQVFPSRVRPGFRELMDTVAVELKLSAPRKGPARITTLGGGDSFRAVVLKG